MFIMAVSNNGCKLFGIMTTGLCKEVIASGWHVPGIVQAIRNGFLKLPTLNPFKNISIKCLNISIKYFHFYEDFLIYLPMISLALCSLILHLKNEFGFKIERCCFVILDIFLVRNLLAVSGG